MGWISKATAHTQDGIEGVVGDLAELRSGELGKSQPSEATYNHVCGSPERVGVVGTTWWCVVGARCGGVVKWCCSARLVIPRQRHNSPQRHSWWRMTSHMSFQGQAGWGPSAIMGPSAMGERMREIQEQSTEQKRHRYKTHACFVYMVSQFRTPPSRIQMSSEPAHA